MRSEVNLKIIQEIQNIIKNSGVVLEVNEKSRLREDLDFDSIKTILLLNKIQMIFDILFEPSELVDIRNISDLVNAVSEKQNNRDD